MDKKGIEMINGVTKGINVNDKHYPFTEWILDGQKTIETRESNSLHSVIGKRVGIIRTGCGPAMLVGFVDVVGYVVYGDKGGFRSDYEKHMVEDGSRYDIKPNGIKFGYILENPEKCDPIPVTSKGIVIRNI